MDRDQGLLVTSGMNATNLVVDYNLYYARTNAAAQVLVGTSTHDEHSVFADPLFVSGTPSHAADFQLSAKSPAMGDGNSVEFLQDFAGTPISTNAPPKMGAYKFNPSDGLPASSTGPADADQWANNPRPMLTSPILPITVPAWKNWGIGGEPCSAFVH